MADLPKTIITLLELEEKFAHAIRSKTGKNRWPESPPEYSSAWENYCRKFWGAWDKQKQLREEQLIYLDLHNVCEIDYYKDRAPIRPI